MSTLAAHENVAVLLCSSPLQLLSCRVPLRTRTIPSTHRVAARKHQVPSSTSCCEASAAEMAAGGPAAGGGASPAAESAAAGGCSCRVAWFGEAAASGVADNEAEALALHFFLLALRGHLRDREESRHGICSKLSSVYMNTKRLVFWSSIACVTYVSLLTMTCSFSRYILWPFRRPCTRPIALMYRCTVWRADSICLRLLVTSGRPCVHR